MDEKWIFVFRLANDYISNLIKLVFLNNNKKVNQICCTVKHPLLSIYVSNNQ